MGLIGREGSPSICRAMAILDNLLLAYGAPSLLWLCVYIPNTLEQPRQQKLQGFRYEPADALSSYLEPRSKSFTAASQSSMIPGLEGD